MSALKPYNQFDLEEVHRHLGDILSMSPQEASALIHQHEAEITALATVFQNTRADPNRLWASYLLAKLPVEAVQTFSSKGAFVAPIAGASLRFLASGTGSEKARTLEAHRQALFLALRESVSPPKRKIYHPFLTWEPIDQAWPMATKQALASDTVFGNALVALEHQFNTEVRSAEEKVRNYEHIAPTDMTPLPLQQAVAAHAFEMVAQNIERCVETETHNELHAADMVTARVGANLSVNRILLEIAANDRCGQEAMAMCVPFLQKLNEHDFYEVPEKFQYDLPDGGESAIRDWLTTLFADRGVLVQADDYFKRPMTTSDIDKVLDWSLQLQEMYCLSRGAVSAKVAHRMSANRFLFALVMVAAFYEKSKTEQEEKGHSRSSYALFPDRMSAKQGLRQEPRAHAMQIFLQAYGQLYYGNHTGWALNAEHVAGYAQLCQNKRGYLQRLLYGAVKHRSVPQLLALFAHLHRLKTKAMSFPEEVVP